MLYVLYHCKAAIYIDTVYCFELNEPPIYFAVVLLHYDDISNVYSIVKNKVSKILRVFTNYFYKSVTKILHDWVAKW